MSAPETLPKPTSWTANVPLIKPGRYSDGLPFNEPNYLSFKLILKPNHFVSRSSFFDFAKIIKRPTVNGGITFTTNGFINEPVQIREVLFVDTRDFRLYNNGFILRRRIRYQDGFPVGDPEVVFKFRHPDIQKVAETDVRPHIYGDYKIKFKCQALPLKDQLGGIRLLYSHNVQFPRSHIRENDILSFDVISQIFPALANLRKSAGERIELVNETIIEEVLQDIGTFDFGSGLLAKANVAIWRTRGDHRPLIGEFAYQLKFNDRKELKLDAMRRAEAHFLSLQYTVKNWLALNATKTGIVYRLLGNAPQTYE
ncbi:hypothetical protein [Solitalea lacus]|uniref:hypothetical protein n=1 Tax=Solitalea lacus TaxID=2911172 RepID=UPI001EDB46A1|nr:hypothetical protein [Solitalea lacus]UKJ08206.1 hypothetical protein L2B55_03320 [Solitalea lacus]